MKILVYEQIHKIYSTARL